MLSSINQSAPIYCRFRNGIVYGYTPGDVVAEGGKIDLLYERSTHVSEKEFYMKFAGKLAQFHSIELVPGEVRRPALFGTLIGWIERVMTAYDKPNFVPLSDAGYTHPWLMAEVRSFQYLLFSHS